MVAITGKDEEYKEIMKTKQEERRKNGIPHHTLKDIIDFVIKNRKKINIEYAYSDPYFNYQSGDLLRLAYYRNKHNNLHSNNGNSGYPIALAVGIYLKRTDMDRQLLCKDFTKYHYESKMDKHEAKIIAQEFFKEISA